MAIAYSVGTPLEEGSARSRGLSTYTTHNLTHLLEAIQINLANYKIQIVINSEAFAVWERRRKSSKSDREGNSLREVGVRGGGELRGRPYSRVQGAINWVAKLIFSMKEFDF
jgi:hypothetical protein